MAQEERKKALFDSAFPDVEDLKVIVTQEGEGVREWSRERYYSKGAGEKVDCSNPLCQEGGFLLWEILREMVGRRSTHKVTSRECQGYEESRSWIKKRKKCPNRFKVIVDIQYRQSGPPSPNGDAFQS